MKQEVLMMILSLVMGYRAELPEIPNGKFSFQFNGEIEFKKTESKIGPPTRKKIHLGQHGNSSS